MIPISNYKKFVTELVRRHMSILGPNIARDVALHVPGLTIDASGEATDISSDPLLVIKDLANGFDRLSGQVSQLLLYTVLEEHPDVKAAYNQPLGRIRLACALTEGHHN